MTDRSEALEILRGLGVRASLEGGHAVRSPIDGTTIASIALDGSDAAERAVRNAAEAFPRWRQTPAPRRGELVRRFGE
ncbi:MAG: aldehyde dehydrogenase family protein, partial [Candidatus Eremiobacteraeota bacterium]|nr:aldehyde dehydrogenase family protein [Candidatus Eremiobacteraeota bacterium]